MAKSRGLYPDDPKFRQRYDEAQARSAAIAARKPSDVRAAGPDKDGFDMRITPFKPGPIPKWEDEAPKTKRK